MFSRTKRLAKSTYGMLPEDAHRKDICIRCKQSVVILATDGSGLWNKELFFTEAGKKKWYISAMCEKCFDSLFDEEEQ